MDETPLEKLLIISVDNKFYQGFQILDIFFQIFSSYYYAYVGTFELPPPGSFFFVLSVFFECYFLISIILKFMVEIKTSEDARPIRNHAIIAKTYLNGEFPLDIITLIPLAYLIDLPGDLE